MPTEIHCPNCRTRVLAENINMEKMAAVCAGCNHVFSFEEELVKATYEKSEVLLPPGIDAFSLPSELNIEIDWRKSQSGFITFFTIFWNALLIPFVVVGITTGEYGMLLGISVHLLVGISLLYYTLACFMNKTFVMVDHYNLHVEHKPLRIPFYPDRHIPVGELDQLFIEKYVASRTNGRPDYAFAVNVRLTNQETLKIIKGLKNMHQARYIEQEIERFLRIEDRPVEEEYLG
jgi:hypothetical protein